MLVKLFDAPISDDELGNLSEAKAAVTLDAPTLTFARQRVATAPMPFRPAVAEVPAEPGATAARPLATPARPATTRRESSSAKRRAGQWLLAAAIVSGLGVGGHFAGSFARALPVKPAHASAPPQATTVHAPATQATEMVAAPVVRIVAPMMTAADVATPQAVAKPKPREHARREATAPGGANITEQGTPAERAAATTEPAKAGADDDLMRQAAETLSSAQLESP